MSGEVLYSAASTLQSGDVYLLGINPGGDPDKQATKTIKDSLSELPTRTKNAYLVKWRDRDPGKAPIQRRVQWLLDALGHELSNVAASNLVFVRSKDASGIIQKYAGLCWPVHVRIIEIVRPKYIITFGQGVFEYLRQRMPVGVESQHPAKHGSWMCRRFDSIDGCRVVGLPHLSRYDIIGKDKVIEWIRESAPE